MVKTYVVFAGRKPGVYERWEEAQAQVNGFSGASYKGYYNKEEALRAFKEFMEKQSVVASSTTAQSSATTASWTTTKSSMTAAISSRKPKQNEKIAQLVDAQVDLAREHQKNALKMMEISEELKIILESMKFGDDD